MILSQLQRVGKTLAEEQKLDSVLCFEHVLITWSVTLLFFFVDYLDRDIDTQIYESKRFVILSNPCKFFYDPYKIMVISKSQPQYTTFF